MKAKALSGFITLAITIVVGYSWLALLTAEPVVERAADAVAVQVCIWPGSNGTNGCTVNDTEVNLVPMQQAQFYAAVLLSDGTVECAPGSTDPTVLFNMTDFPAACDSATALLDFSLATQDTILRWVRFVWASDTTVVDYNIQVLNLADSVLLDTIVPTSPIEWMDGQQDVAYRVKGRTRVMVDGAPRAGTFGALFPFVFPGVVNIPAMPVIQVDTIS